MPSFMSFRLLRRNLRIVIIAYLIKCIWHLAIKQFHNSKYFACSFFSAVRYSKTRAEFGFCCFILMPESNHLSQNSIRCNSERRKIRFPFRDFSRDERHLHIPNFSNFSPLPAFQSFKLQKLPVWRGPKG